MANLGKSIRKARLAAGLNQRELGEKLGLLGGTTIYRWEHNRTEPGIAMLRKVARVLGVSIGELVK